MGKAEKGTPKYIANKIKSKGLQKLRWFCQMCEKQCRDENGFKCHTSSEAHQRQLLLFAETPESFLDAYSGEFEKSFISLLSRCHGTKRTFANAVYQEYIKEKDHTHMNATKWTTLTGFIQHLGKSGKCVVDETEKGWYITWIDRDPETIARQEASNKKVKLAQDDQEKEAEFIRKQVELDRLRKGEEAQSIYTALIRSDAEEKIQLGLKLPPTLDAKPFNSSSKLSSNVFKSSSSKKYDEKPNSSSKEKRKATSAMEEIMQAELSSKKKQHQSSSATPPKPADKPWLAKRIMVKIVAKSLGDKYYKQKGHIKELVDPYTGIVVTNSGAKLKLDQSHLETVIPAKGRTVIILRGKRKGHEAILRDIIVEEFKAELEFSDGDLLTLPYEEFSKKYQE